jgi:hypothetical protein
MFTTYSAAEESGHYNNWTSSIGHLNGKQDSGMKQEKKKTTLDIYKTETHSGLKLIYLSFVFVLLIQQ